MKKLKKNAITVVDEIIKKNSSELMKRSIQEDIIEQTIKKCFGQKTKKTETSMLSINVGDTTYEFWKNGQKIIKIMSILPGTKIAQKDETTEISKKQAMIEITQLFIKAFCDSEVEAKEVFEK